MTTLLSFITVNFNYLMNNFSHDVLKLKRIVVLLVFALYNLAKVLLIITVIRIIDNIF